MTCADDREKVAPGSAVSPNPLTSTGVKSGQETSVSFDVIVSFSPDHQNM